DLPSTIFSEPDDPVRIDLDSSWPRVRCRRGPFCHFPSFRLHLPNLSALLELREPRVAILIDFDSVWGNHVPKMGKLARLGVKNGEGRIDGSRPHLPVRTHPDGVFRSAILKTLHSRRISVLILRN